MDDHYENKKNPKPNKRYLHMASATEESIDAFIDALLDDEYEDVVDPDTVIRKILRYHGVDPSQSVHYWTQKPAQVTVRGCWRWWNVNLASGMQ